MGGKKKKARDDTLEKCEEISSVLKGAECLPEALREMLCAGVAAALSKFKDDRHEYQTAVVGWIEEALNTIQAAHETSLADSKAKVDGAETEKGNLETAATAAQENLLKLQDASADAEMKSSNLSLEADERSSALEEAKASEQTAIENTEAAAGKKEELSALLAQDGQFVKWQSAAAEKKEANAFVKLVKSKSKFEQILLQSLVPTLLVAPESRTEFDKLVLHHFQKAVEKDIAAQADILSAAEETKAKHAESVREAQVALDTAKAAAEAGTVAAAEAVAAVKQGNVDLKAARASLREHGPSVKAASADFKNTESVLEEFKSGPLAAFIDLRDRAPEEPEEAPAAEVEASEEVEASSKVEASTEIELPTEA